METESIIKRPEKTEAPSEADKKAGRAKILRILRSIAGLLCFFLMPFISFYLFEMVTGNLANIEGIYRVYNIAFIYCLYLVLFGISGSTRITIPVISTALFVLSVAESFVVGFRNRPIMVSDLNAFGTAMSVASNYVFSISTEMKQAASVLLGLDVLAVLCPFRVKKLKQRGGLFGICALSVVLFCGHFYKSVCPRENYDINSWDVESTYEDYGYLMATAVSLRYVVAQAPEGYSQGKLADIVAEIGTGEDEQVAETADITPVNIICIMNESFSDLQVAGDFTTNVDYMPFWKSLTENTVRGSLCVPVFGSMTCNTEAEFLTGDSTAILPMNSNAYQFNIRSGALSLVSTLKNQGYRAVAMHPYPADNWNRKTVYADFGFDTFYDIEHYEGAEQLRNYVSDQADFAALIQQVEEKDSPDDKLFLFNVTMQNHGGYAYKYENFPEEVQLTGDLAGKYPEAEQYLSLVKRTDAAFEQLITYFQNCDQPTMIVMFGDHQPAVENGFYYDIAGLQENEVLPAADRLIWYQTPFVIWTNYEQPSENMGKLSALYLSSYVLKLSGLEMTPYNRYLLSLSQDVPVISPLGCFDADGNYYSWEEADTDACPFGEEILKYEYLAYNHSLGGKKYNAAFSLPDSN